jgi:DNA-binding LacI/PurR family transcriptional regulator
LSRPPATPLTRQPARLEDVARAAGVHPSTASRVLNGGAKATAIREETQARVLRAAKQLGYRPNAVARSLALGETRTLSLLIPSLRNPVLAELVRGACVRASERGFVMLTAEEPGDSGGDGIYTTLLHEGRIQGSVIANARLDDPAIERFIDSGIPCVFANRRFEGSNRNVSMREEDAGQLAAYHLLELGHRNVAFLSGATNLDTAVRRAQGFGQAMRAAGVSPSVIHAEYDEAAAYAATAQLVSQGSPFTALCTSNLNQAIGALAALRRSGLTVPRDVSLIACDDDPLLEYLEVAVTSVRMPLLALGRAAVDALIAQMEGAEPRDMLVDLAPELIVRESTIPIQGSQRSG